MLDNLTSIDYANSIRNKITINKTNNDPKYYGAVMTTPEDSGTSHVSVLAPDGSAVSVTSTINQVYVDFVSFLLLNAIFKSTPTPTNRIKDISFNSIYQFDSFGAMRRSRSTGIIFNDEMDDFSSPNITNGFDLPPSPANFIRPGKRPMSSMSPTIVVSVLYELRDKYRVFSSYCFSFLFVKVDKNGEVRLVIGAAGGTKITSAVAIAMVLNLWSGYNVKQAIDALRIHHQVKLNVNSSFNIAHFQLSITLFMTLQLLPMVVQNEKGFSPDVLNYLWSIGHNVSTYSGIGSAITAISKQNGEIIASSDFRREGRTAGF